MEFTNLILSRKYKSTTSNIINDFYLPVLGNSVSYKRAVGYFSSSIMVDYILGLKNFVDNNGKIQLIISPFVSIEDAKSFFTASDKDAYVSSNLNDIFDHYKEYSKRSFLAAKLMVALIKEGFLEIQVAVPTDLDGLFHEKISIFTDSKGNKIATDGSNNETTTAVTHNIESFNVFCSWIDGQSDYVDDHEIDFDTYWENEDPMIDIMSLKKALLTDKLIDFNTNESIKELYMRIEEGDSKPVYEFPINLYPFQKTAVDKWMIDKRGIFKFATGTGKTKTAIRLIYELREKLNFLFVIIVVPDMTLVNQWSYELLSAGYSSLKCFSDNPKWNITFKDFVDEFKMNLIKLPIVVVTKDSFSDSKFISEMSKLKENVLFIADECHRLGTDNLIAKLPRHIMFRLGLSATPEVYFSESRTHRLFDYFGGIIAEYDIEQAIRSGYLVGYNYIPVIVTLNEDEKTKYIELTRKIVKLLGFDDESKIVELTPEAELLLFSRARIVYGAEDKLKKLESLICNPNLLNHLLIYCGATSISQSTDYEEQNQSLTQLQSVNQMLIQRGINAAQYTQSENGDVRQISIESFKNGLLSTLVAIKCLDEGVNIPEIQNAIILASSGNPREFVQRRGRLLRTCENKLFSNIYDMICLVDDHLFDGNNRKEIKRLYEFSRLALNKNDVFSDFNSYIQKYILEETNNE